MKSIKLLLLRLGNLYGGKGMVYTFIIMYIVIDCYFVFMANFKRLAGIFPAGKSNVAVNYLD